MDQARKFRSLVEEGAFGAICGLFSPSPLQGALILGDRLTAQICPT